MTTRIYMPVQTVNFAAKIIGCPQVTPDEAAYIVWEHTGYPSFFSDAISFERQILEFMREWKKLGRWPPHPLDRLPETESASQPKASQ